MSDTGIGIEPGAITRIFEAFNQTRDGAAAGGTGLGLTISRHLIQTMGDQLKVESTPGRGSRFYFALPLVCANDDRSLTDEDDAGAEPSLDARLAPGQDLMALVVDDSTVNRRILARLLESAGVRVITAAGGAEALRLVREHRPDVVFMDLRMGDLDGLEATRRIKADPLVADIPIIAVTASAFGDTREAASRRGLHRLPLKAGPRRIAVRRLAHAPGRAVRIRAGSRSRARTGALGSFPARGARAAPARGGGDWQRHRPRGAGAGTGGWRSR